MRNEIIYGGKSFTDSDIESVELHLACGLLSSQLEADTITASVKSGDRSLTRFARNAPLQYFHRGAERFRGYVQSVERVGPEMYSIYATSVIGLLTERPHVGGIYTGQTAEEVIQDICGGFPVIVKSNIRDERLYGWLPYVKPPQSSARDNLNQVLFALGAAVRMDALGALRVFRLWDGASGAAPMERVYRGAGVEYEGAVSAVSVTEHQYTQGGEETTLFEGAALEGDVIQFSEPLYALLATGFSIRSSGANYAVLSAGEGTLTGRKYLHSTREITRTVTPGVPENVQSVSDATLISLVNSNAAAARLAAYYQCRETIRCGIVLKRQTPGDVIRAYQPYDKVTVSGCVESVDVTVSGILKADTRILAGYTPPTAREVSYYSRRLVVTKSGEITLPADTASLRAVLIGGGFGGRQGTYGTAGEAGGNASFYGPNGDSIGRNGEAGKGGAAGAGGSGGKIYIVDIKNPPEKLNVSIGSGQNGYIPLPNGNWSHTDNSAEMPTTLYGGGIFYSSDSGAPSASGYTDPVTGEVYALPGADGAAGGDGGGAGGVEITSPDNDGFNEIWTPTPGETGEASVNAPGGSGNSNFTILTSKYVPEDRPDYMRTVRVRTGLLPAGGGGAAYSAYGQSATDAHSGGAGANAPSPPPASSPGSGGNGGHGGGGGGAGGAAFVSMRKRAEPEYYAEASQDGAPGGAAGAGSAGGKGADGCVILYFSERIVHPSGALMDSGRRFVIDRLGRLIVF